MPLYFWWEAFSTAVFLINKLPTPVINNENPHFLMFSKDPDYGILKPFGCACYPCLKPYNRNKLQFHTSKCVFIGYSNNHKGYKCINSTGRIFVSRHVVFNEECFPFHDGFINTKQPVELTTQPAAFFYPDIPTGNHEEQVETTQEQAASNTTTNIGESISLGNRINTQNFSSQEDNASVTSQTDQQVEEQHGESSQKETSQDTPTIADTEAIEKKHT